MVPAHLRYQDTPITELVDETIASAGVSLYVKREDLNHPFISGNKWWKLKYNLEYAMQRGFDTLLTFGGAFSNHIYATAAAAELYGLKSVGIIRGEEVLPLNSTLQSASDQGMQLHYLSRSEYRRKDDVHFITSLASRFGNCYVIPEGGSNELGVAGIASFAEHLPEKFDYICCPLGTGATLAGLTRGRRGIGKLIGFPVLKGGDAWNTYVNAFNPGYTNWRTIGDYHFGGYAKSNDVLNAFIDQFHREKAIPLEPVYSGKMFFGIYDLLRKGYFEPGSEILAIHTGGLR